jgi:hypothetical protein
MRRSPIDTVVRVQRAAAVLAIGVSGVLLDAFPSPVGPGGIFGGFLVEVGATLAIAASLVAFGLAGRLRRTRVWPWIAGAALDSVAAGGVALQLLAREAWSGWWAAPLVVGGIAIAALAFGHSRTGASRSTGVAGPA